MTSAPEMRLTHTFVEFIPEVLREGVLYVSVAYGTAVHKCCCGCGRRVVTPITPTDWKLTFDGKSVSLYPSIGNWAFPCQAHYWITNNRVRWAPRWTRDEIAAGHEHDRVLKDRYYGVPGTPHHDVPAVQRPASAPAQDFLSMLKSWFS